ncbi:MAG: hypothetical protein ACOC0P_04735 [Planctomycetota bacterium]
MKSVSFRDLALCVCLVFAAVMLSGCKCNSNSWCAHTLEFTLATDVGAQVHVVAPDDKSRLDGVEPKHYFDETQGYQGWFPTRTRKLTLRDETGERTVTLSRKDEIWKSGWKDHWDLIIFVNPNKPSWGDDSRRFRADVNLGRGWPSETIRFTIRENGIERMTQPDG